MLHAGGFAAECEHESAGKVKGYKHRANDDLFVDDHLSGAFHPCSGLSAASTRTLLAGLLTFYWYRIINRLSSPVLMFDAAGLALFAVFGASKALAFHAGPVAATLLGMLTGVGGGMVRDNLVAEIPTVLRTELYAIAALIGAATVVIGNLLHLPSSAVAVTATVLCFALRFMAIRRGWHLPTARPPEQSR